MGNTNVNVNVDGITNGNVNGLMPIFQAEELLQGRAIASSDASLQLPAMTEDTLLQLPTMSDETETELFAWVASLDGDSEYQLISGSSDGSNAGSGSGNSAGVEMQLPADCRCDGVQSAPWYAHQSAHITVLVSIFAFAVVGVNPNTESGLAVFFDGYLDMERDYGF